MMRRFNVIIQANSPAGRERNAERKRKKKCHDGANKRFSSQTRIYEQGNSRF